MKPCNSEAQTFQAQQTSSSSFKRPLVSSPLVGRIVLSQSLAQALDHSSVVEVALPQPLQENVHCMFGLSVSVLSQSCGIWEFGGRRHGCDNVNRFYTPHGAGSIDFGTLCLTQDLR